MSLASDLAYEQSYFRISFTLDGTLYRYTTWTEDLPGGYESDPRIEIKLPANTGTLEDSYAEITLPSDDFTETLTGSEPLTDVQVEIDEVISDPTGPSSATLLRHFVGILAGEAVRNPGGQGGIVRLEARLGKSLLDIPLGIPCNHQCPFTLYGTGSGVSSVLHRFVGTVTAIDGLTVTVNTDPLTATFATPPDRYFKSGFALLNGLYVRIRDWRSASPREFRMSRRMPAAWLGEAVEFFAGSDKTYETIRDNFGTPEFFGGIGYAIPPYNPNFEDSPGGG